MEKEIKKTTKKTTKKEKAEELISIEQKNTISIEEFCAIDWKETPSSLIFDNYLSIKTKLALTEEISELMIVRDETTELYYVDKWRSLMAFMSLSLSYSNLDLSKGIDLNLYDTLNQSVGIQESIFNNYLRALPQAAQKDLNLTYMNIYSYAENKVKQLNEKEMSLINRFNKIFNVIKTTVNEDTLPLIINDFIKQMASDEKMQKGVQGLFKIFKDLK